MLTTTSKRVNRWPLVIKSIEQKLAARALSTKDSSSVNKKEFKESNTFCLNLFRGKLNTTQILPFPLNLNEERKETLQMVLPPLKKFLEQTNNPVENDEKAMMPMEKLKEFSELGAFGILVPEKYGGAAMNNTQMAKLAEMVGGNDLGLSVVMGAHQSIGYKGILLYGTEEQKQKYLPDLATGKKFAAFCLTEPSSGSDANSIQSRAVKSECGKYYILNGGKIWISNGGFAEVFTVFAQTPIKQPDGSTKDKVSAFIVERGPGLTNGPPEKKMGIKGSNTAALYFNDVKIPVENLIGEEGEGFMVAMNILNNGRFGIPAACTGAMKFCIGKTIEHINSRVQFGKKLRDYGNVKEKLTDMILRHYATESIVYMLAANMDAGIQDYQLEAAIGKVFASENAWHVCDEAIQLYGGMGFMRETLLERVLRDLRIFRIFEGANDVMRLFIALTGSQYLGTYLRSQGKVSLIGSELCRRFSRENQMASKVHSELKECSNSLSKVVKEFGTTAMTLITTHKQGIIERQYELIRLANAAINCYAMAATISRCNYVIDKCGATNAKNDLQITKLFVDQATRKALSDLVSIASISSTELDNINKIAVAVCDNQDIIVRHPIDLD